MDAIIMERYHQWRGQPMELEDPDLALELKTMTEEEEIRDCFYRNLAFGTGGLRGVIGAGTNRMNLYTVAKATQGYANYLNRHGGEPSVAIAYDSRIKSDLFARTAARVFAANKIRVCLYRELMPTPSLSFAVRHLRCSGGVVITASHNPAKYNGYKVYGSDGCQITTEAADEIMGEIEAIDIFQDVKKVDYDAGVAAGWIACIEEDTVTAFINAVSGEALCRNEPMDRDVAICYTPLNGTGLMCVTRVLRENGFTNLTVVKEQEKPDGSFPTCPFPNPEMKEAMALGLEYARKTKSDLLLATDPDCDRVGIAVRDGDDYRLLSGNEVGMLLLDFICKRRLALGTMPERPVAVKTIVTIDMAKRIAADYGVEMTEVLTGFKFIGEQIGLLEKKGEAGRYIFGFEESYGYLSGSYVRDKDAVDASLLICEMFAYYKTHGLTLPEVLEGLYQNYGYCLNTLRSFQFEGADGFEKMQKIMASFREEPPTDFGGKAVVSVSDYQKSVTVDQDGEPHAIYLPKSDVLKYALEDDASVVIRPSGTEPKIKVYFSVSAPDRATAGRLEEEMASELEARLR